VLHNGHKHMTLPEAARVLDLHPRTLSRYLDQPDTAGFTVFERMSSNGRRLRYLPAHEVRRAMEGVTTRPQDELD
jgi:hypothetical protein